MTRLDAGLTRRNFLLAMGSTVGAVVLEACAAAPTVSPAAPGAPAAVRPVFAMTGASASLVIQPAIGNTLLGMHPKLGWYKEEGIDAKFIGADGGLNGLRLIQTKQITTGIANQESIYGLAARGEDPGATMYFQFGYAQTTTIGVNPNSPITTLAQLKGMKIGTALGGSNHAFAGQVLKNLGIDPLKDVTFVSTPSAAGGQALKDGKIDALAAGNFDFPTMQAQFGIATRALPWPDYVAKMRTGSTLSASNEFIQNNPAIIAGIGRVCAKGALFMNANARAAIEMVWDLFPESLPKGISRSEATAQQLDGIVDRAKYMLPVGRPQEIGYLEPEAWKVYVEFLGYKELDSTKYYTNKFIADINKFDHDAITALAKTF